MYLPSDQIQGSPTFHTVVNKQADGTYTAKNVSMTDVPPVNAPSEAEAIRAVRSATEEFIGKGAGKK